MLEVVQWPWILRNHLINVLSVSFPSLEVFPGKNGEAIRIAKGERLLMELSRKFTVGDINRLATVSGYFVQAAWRTRQYGVQMLLPMEEALRRCWRDTDDFFLNHVSFQESLSARFWLG
jgi:hypothetical protein